jgi:hypothetical protein
MRSTLTRFSATLLATMLLATAFFVPVATATEAATNGAAAEASEKTPERHKRPKIRCHGTTNELTGAPEVDCTWTESARARAAAYKVVRKGGGERAVVYRGDLSTTSFADTNVEFGTRYRYRVVVLNNAGKRIQRSRWNKAFIPAEDFERLSISCDQLEAAEEAEPADVAVTCAWRAAENEDVASYQLWRRVRGHHRELVADLATNELSYTDAVPADAKRVVYAVLALDSDDHIIGRSGITKVKLS